MRHGRALDARLPRALAARAGGHCAGLPGGYQPSNRGAASGGGGMAVVYFIWPEDGLEILCIIYAVQVMVVNGSPFGDDMGVVRAAGVHG